MIYLLDSSDYLRYNKLYYSQGWSTMTKPLNSNFNFEYIYRDSYFTMNANNNFDSYYGLYYLVYGERKFFIDRKIYLLKKGDFLFINKNTLHRSTYYTDTPHERILIKFTDKIIENLIHIIGKEQFLQLFVSPQYHIPNKVREKLLSLLKNIEFEFTDKDDYSEFLIQGYLNNLLITLIRYIESGNNSPLSLTKEEKNILTIVDYIHENYKSCPALTDAAKMAFLSPSYFSRSFKKTTGFNYSVYLTNVKIYASIKLLLETNKTIQQISEESGFSNSNYYCDVFRKIMSVSPRRYRKKFIYNK